MENKKISKRAAYLIVVIITLTIMILLLTSYALWQRKLFQRDTNKILGACLEIKYESNSSGVSLSKEWPKSDAEGVLTEGYTFTVTNKCSEDVPYEVVLESLTPSSGTEMPGDYIRVKLDNNDIKTFGNLTPIDNDTDDPRISDIHESKVVYTGMLKADTTVTHTIKSWISEDAPNSTIGNKFDYKVKVIAGQGITVANTVVCYEINDQGVLTKYNAECGTNVVIPASYNGKDIKSIDTYAFYDTHYYTSKQGVTLDDLKNADIALAFSERLINAMDNNDESIISVINNDDFKIITRRSGEDILSVVNMIKTEAQPFSTLVSAIATNTGEYTGECTYDENSCNYGYYSYLINVVEENNNYEPETIGIYYGGSEPIEGEEDPVFIPETIDFSQATNLEEIGLGAFSSYVGTGTDLVLPSSLKVIGNGAFAGFNGNSITLPENLEEINIGAFYKYVGTGTTLAIPASVKLIGENAFNNFKGDALELKYGLKELYCNAFAYYDGATVTIPASVTTIGGGQPTNEHGSGSQCWPDNRVFRYMTGQFIAKSQALYDSRGTWATNGNQVTLDLN